MRISDWSSDVCASDLLADPVFLRGEELVGEREERRLAAAAGEERGGDIGGIAHEVAELDAHMAGLHIVRGELGNTLGREGGAEIGRASCREGGCSLG